MLARAERGIPMGPCVDTLATHYGDAYLFNPAQGGTCDINPPYYANIGGLVAVAGGPNSLYSPFDVNHSDGCGVCYEVYGLNGAHTVIVADFGSENGTVFNLESHDNIGSWDTTIGFGIGAHQITYRQVSCPQTQGSNNWVVGNVQAHWSQGSDQFYFQLVYWNFKVGIKAATATCNGMQVYTLNRMAVDNSFVFSGQSCNLPLVLTITSWLGEVLTTTVGTASQTIAGIGGNGQQFDFGSQFTNTQSSHNGDPDCTPAADPAIIYDDYLYYDRPTSPVQWGWREIVAYSITSHTYTYATGCQSGIYCIQVQYQQYGGLEIGVVALMKADWSGISFWAKADENFSGGMTLTWSGETDAFAFDLTTTWTQFTMTFSSYPGVPTEINPGYFTFFCNAASPPAVYFDNIQMTGGDGRANYLPGATFFPSGGGSDASALSPLKGLVL